MLLQSSVLFADVREPYSYVNVLPFDPHGWFCNASHLDLILQNNNIQTVIEVGSCLGCSTRHLAKGIADKGIVYAVDTWLGTPNEDHSAERLAGLYQQFLSNVIHANLTHKIIPVRMASLEAAQALSVKADLIYIDASHDTESVYKDIISRYPHLNKKGIMCGDDWWAESVKKGVFLLLLN